MNTPRSAERRGGKRTRARLPIRFWTATSQGHGHTLDLSASGLFVETTATLPIGTRLHFEIDHPDGAFRGEAVVTRQKRVPQHLRTLARPGVGLRLVPITSLLRTGGEATSSTTLFELRLDLSDRAVLRRAHAGELRAGVIFVPCPSPPPVGATVQVDAKLPDPYGTLHWRGRVVQWSARPSGAAVELLDRAQVEALAREILGS